MPKATRKKPAPNKKLSAQQVRELDEALDRVIASDQQFGAPIHVAVPNTTAEKMRAINTVAEGLLQLAKALNGVNTNITVSNCRVTSMQAGGTGINFAGI